MEMPDYLDSEKRLRQMESLQRKIEVPRPIRMSDIPVPQQPAGLKAMMAIAEGGLASEFCKRLTEYCQEFDAELDAEHEVGAKLVSYGESVMLYVESIGYYDPSLIHFDGVLADEKTPVRLVQHVSQISFLLMALPKKDPDKPKQPFGFAANFPENDGK